MHFGLRKAEKIIVASAYLRSKTFDPVYSPNHFLESLFQNFRVDSRAFAPIFHFSLHRLAASKKNHPNILALFILLKIVGFTDNSSQSTKLRFFLPAEPPPVDGKESAFLLKKVA
jgi:hypothetical protein